VTAKHWRVLSSTASDIQLKLHSGMCSRNNGDDRMRKKLPPEIYPFLPGGLTTIVGFFQLYSSTLKHLRLSLSTRILQQLCGF